jgi:DNA-binding MarR family transcriptional regulator
VRNSWTFLTNHSHVLLCIARDPDLILRDIAAMVGITERAVQNIIYELEEAGFIKKIKDGRKNKYTLKLSKSLRHPLEEKCKIKDLIELLL